MRAWPPYHSPCVVFFLQDHQTDKRCWETISRKPSLRFSLLSSFKTVQVIFSDRIATTVYLNCVCSEKWTAISVFTVKLSTLYSLCGDFECSLPRESSFYVILPYFYKKRTTHAFTRDSLKVFLTRKPNMIRRWNLHLSLAESQKKTLEAHGCKPWVAKLSMVPHTLGILTANVTYCVIFLEDINESHVNACTVYVSKAQTLIPFSIGLLNSSR